MNRLRTFFHVHRWNLWAWLARNEAAWMRCMDRVFTLERQTVTFGRTVVRTLNTHTAAIHDLRHRMDALEGKAPTEPLRVIRFDPNERKQC